MKVEPLVTAYGVEQDRLRALLPDGFESLRPVLRITTIGLLLTLVGDCGLLHPDI